MHQTKSYLGLAAVAALCGVIGLSACVVTTDDGTGGAAGSPSAAGAGGAAAGSSAAGAATAGAATAGAAGEADTSTVPACDKNLTPAGTPAPTCQAQDTDDCSKCIEKNCCMEFSQCFGTSPGNVCGYGGPMDVGEFPCYQACLIKITTASGGVLTAEDQGTCANQCATQKSNKGSLDCGSSIGIATNDLINCIADAKCNTVCYGGGD